MLSDGSSNTTKGHEEMAINNADPSTELFGGPLGPSPYIPPTLPWPWHPPPHSSGEMALRYGAAGSSTESSGVYRVHPHTYRHPYHGHGTPSITPVRQNGLEISCYRFFN